MRRELPPYETSGNGIPVTGAIPIVMPTLMKSPIINVQMGLVLIFLNQKSCGESTLHAIIVQYAQAY